MRTQKSFWVLIRSRNQNGDIIWGAVCKKNYLEQICDIFSYLEIIKTENLFINKPQNLSHDM